MERRPPVTSLIGLYAAYLLGAFLMLAALLAYLQAKGLRPGLVVAAAIGFMAGAAGVLLAVLAAWGGGR
jgi:ABC-type Mn2+/Zn2+ transport system permease subunit